MLHLTAVNVNDALIAEYKRLIYIMNRRMPAFTLLELLIVMVLSGIVSASIYLTFSYIQKYYSSFKENQEYISSYSNLHHRLQEDFHRSAMVYRGEGQLHFQQARSAVNYEFLDGMISRQQGALIDTFFVEFQNLQFFLDQEEVLKDEHLINEVKFSALVKGEELLFHFSVPIFLVGRHLSKPDNFMQVAANGN